jgi:hypothetical protein
MRLLLTRQLFLSCGAATLEKAPAPIWCLYSPESARIVPDPHKRHAEDGVFARSFA